MARTSVELGGKTSKFIVLASVCIVVSGLYFAREVLIPIALAVLFSFLLTPLVRRLEKWQLPRVAATLIVVLVANAALVSIGYVVFRQFENVVEQLPNYRGQLHEKWTKLQNHGGMIKKAEQELHNMGASSPPAASQPAATNGQEANHAAAAAGTPAGQIPAGQNPMPVRLVEPPQSTLQATLSAITDYGSKFLSPLATAFLVLVLVIFMLLTREDLRDRLIRLIGHGQLNLTTQATDDAGSRISRYLGALAIVNSAYGACVAGGLWVIGRSIGDHPFPSVLVWGLLVGLFRFIPYIGIWIGAAMPMALAFALYTGNGVFLAALGLFIVLEVVVGQFIEPYWYGASTGMSALAVLVAAVFWTWLWGPIGLLLSTPLTVCLVVMGKYVPQLHFLDILLGDEPVLPPHTRLYQRLIASDEEEAAELAQEVLKDRTLERVYDEVLIPALLLAERDYHRDRLEETKLKFIHQSIRDMVEELGDDAQAKRMKDAAAETERAAKDQSTTEEVSRPRPSLPKDCTVNVFCVPAKGDADEIVARMLAQLLELRGYCTFAGSTDQLASEMVEAVEANKAHIVAVSAMPPAAVAHARYLCKRLHGRFADIRMIVGVWHAKADPDRIKQRIACEESVHVVTLLAQAQEQIDQLAQSPALRVEPSPAAPVA
jgi:predicted PurR-regulated permease PerM/methanogenic corrinoid protein MtbC1